MEINKKKFIFVYGFLSLLFILIIASLYIFQFKSLKKNIFSEYQDVYIENRKAHLKDIISHIFYGIENMRDKLQNDYSKIVNRQVETYYSYSEEIFKILKQNKTNIEQIKNEIIQSLNNFKKINNSTSVSLFLIDQNGNYLIAPEFSIKPQQILKLKNKFFIVKYKNFTPLNLKIGVIANIKKAEEKIKKYVISNLSNYRYDREQIGYVFVIEMKNIHGKLKAIRLVNPNKPPSSIGKEIPINITDIDGKMFFKEMIDKCFKNGEGFVNYKFKIPGSSKIGEKITYVRYLKDWHWIIGTGFYLDIFKSQLKKRDKTLNSVIKLFNYQFLTGLVIFQLILFLIFLYYMLKFLKKIEIYVRKTEENEKFKDTLVNLLPNPLFVLDANGDFIEVNLSFENFFGVSREDIFNNKNQNILIFKKIMRADIELEKDKKLNGKNKMITEFDVTDARGDIRRVEIYKSFLYKNNTLSGLIGIIFDITDQVSTTEKLYNQTIKDELTDTFNRRYLSHIFPIEKERAERNNYDLSLIMFDIDHFKKINDNFGHQTGDKVLKKLSKLVKSNIRSYDYLFRIGGEEFVILVIKSDLNNSYNIAQKLRKTVANYKFDSRFKVTISLGVTEVKKDDTLESSIKRADSALYRAKNSGRNRVEKE